MRAYSAILELASGELAIVQTDGGRASERLAKLINGAQVYALAATNALDQVEAALAPDSLPPSEVLFREAARRLHACVEVLRAQGQRDAAREAVSQ